MLRASIDGTVTSDGWRALKLVQLFNHVLGPFEKPLLNPNYEMRMPNCQEKNSRELKRKTCLDLAAWVHGKAGCYLGRETSDTRQGSPWHLFW
jgi:hypothetical protein